jgi:hypothetical protein
VATPEELLAFAQQFENPAGSPSQPEAPAPLEGQRDPAELHRFADMVEFADLQANPAGRAGPSTFEAPDAQKDLADEFVGGLGAGVDSLQMALFGIARQVGRDIDFADLEDFGTEGIRGNIEQMQQFGPSVSGFTDIESIEDFFRWSAGALGQAVPSLGAAMTGGGIGAVLGKKAVERSIRRQIERDMVRDLVGKGFTREAAEQASSGILRSTGGMNGIRNALTAGEVASVARGGQLGAALGATGVSVPQQTGEALTGESDVPLGTALLAGVAGGALEALPALRLLKKAFPGTDPRIAGNFVKDFVKATGSQSLIEGSTEAAQEMIQIAAAAYHDPFFDLMDPLNAKQVIDSFAAGALVGAVTGGGAETIGAVTQPAQRPKIEPAAVDPVNDGFPEDFEPADNTVFEEIRDRVNVAMTGTVGPAVNTIRDQFQQGVDKIAARVPGLNRAVEELSGPIRRAHNEFIEGHKPIIEDAQRYARESIAWITEQAEKIADPDQRRQFIDEQMAEVREQFDSVAQDLKTRAEALLRRTQQDVDGIGVFDDDFGVSQGPVDSDFVFGQEESFENEQGVKVTRQTRGDNVVPFETEQKAYKAVAKLLDRFPNAAESSFEVRQEGDGWVVQIDDSGQRDVLVEDDQVAEAVQNARLSARGNPDRSRQAHVQMKGVTGKTFLDIPSLIYASRKLVTTQNESVENAFNNLLAHMLDRNMIGDDGFNTLREAFLKRYPDRFRKQRLTEQLRLENSELGRELREGRRNLESVIDDDNQATELQGTEQEFMEEGQFRDLESDEDQARRQSSASTQRPLEPGESREEVVAEQRERLKKESIAGARKKKARKAAKKKGAINRGKKRAKKAKAKPKPKPKPKQTQQEKKMTSGSKVEVFMRTPDGKKMADGVLRESIRELANRVANLLSDNVKIRIINRSAALEMVRKGHEHAAIAQELLDHSRFAVKYNANGPTYILVDDFENAGESMAAMIHEMGHLIHYDTWAQLSESEQDKLWNAFLDDVKAGRTTGSRINRVGTSMDHPAAAINMFEFREWMADNFVVWMGNRRQPRNALERFMEAVAQKLDQFWEFIKANPGRFNLNETYAEFADALARKVAGVDPTGNEQFFLNEGAAGRPTHVLFDGSSSVTPKGTTEKEWNALKKRYSEQYPAIARRAKTITEWIKSAYHLAVAPSTSVMRSLADSGITAANELVQIFNRADHGKPKMIKNYHQRTFLMKGRFMDAFDRIFGEMSDAQKTALLRRLREMDGDPNAGPRTLRERQVRKLFDDMHEYLKKQGLPVGKIPNYFPRTFSREKLIAGEAAVMNHIINNIKKRHPNKSADRVLSEARRFYNSLISFEAEKAAALSEMAMDDLAMQSPSFKAMRSREAADNFFDAYLEDNVEAVIANYINHAVKRAEYNRVLGSKADADLIGGDRLTKERWNPQGRLDELMEQAREQGATEEQLKQMKNYVDANLGMYGRDSIPDNVRGAMAGVVAYQNMRVLLFTVFASLPDMVGPAIRSGNMKESFKTMMANLKKAAQDDNDLADMARAFGIISNVANQHVLTEYVDNHYMPPTIRKWNDAFFKWTGLNWYTDFTRKAALAVGMDSIKNEAKKVNDESLTQKQQDRAKQFLAELGLTADIVNAWVEGGERTWQGAGYDNESAADQAVAEALVQFVDEAILRPNASQRPILASHPAAMLVYHLKGYIYAIHDTILKRLAHNFKIADTPAQTIATLAPAIGMMLLTAVGLELRELVTGSDRTGAMDGWDYTWEVAERSGLLGLAQLGWDFESAGARGQSELAGLSGPTVSQLGDLISRPISQTIPKAIPVVSQLPWARDTLREATPL